MGFYIASRDRGINPNRRKSLSLIPFYFALLLLLIVVNPVIYIIGIKDRLRLTDIELFPNAGIEPMWR